MNDEDREITEGIEEYEDNIRELSWEDSDSYYDYDDPYSGEYNFSDAAEVLEGPKKDRLGDVILESNAYYSDLNYLNIEIKVGEDRYDEGRIDIIYGHVSINKITSIYLPGSIISNTVVPYGKFGFNKSVFDDHTSYYYFTKTINVE